MSAKWKQLAQTISEAHPDTDVYYRDPFTVAVVTLKGSKMPLAER